MGAAQTATGFLRPLQKVAGEHLTSTEALRTFGVQVGIALGESFSAGSTKRQVWTSSVSCGFIEELADEDLCVEARSIVSKLCESYATNVAYAAIKRVESTELLVSILDEVLHRRTRVMGTNRVARRSESVCASVWSLGGHAGGKRGCHPVASLAGPCCDALAAVEYRAATTGSSGRGARSEQRRVFSKRLYRKHCRWRAQLERHRGGAERDPQRTNGRTSCAARRVQEKGRRCGFQAPLPARRSRSP